MRQYFSLFCFFCITAVADEYWNPPETLPTGPKAAADVFLSFDPSSESLLATWPDLNTNHPQYAIYHEATWSDPTFMSEASSVSDMVFSSFNAAAGSFFATWTDFSNHFYPTYSSYMSGSEWITPSPITTLIAARMNAYTAFDPVTGLGLAVWADKNNNRHPSYAIYNPGTGWGIASAISTSSQVKGTITLCWNSSTKTFLVSWADEQNNSYPTYAVYTPGVGFGSIQTITTASSAKKSVYTSFDSALNTYLATWTDTGHNYPTYSTYTDASGWKAPLPIGTSSEVDTDVFVLFAPLFNNPSIALFMATWIDVNTNMPNYSIYTPENNTWTPISTITTASLGLDNVFSSFDPITMQYVFAGWTDKNSQEPMIAIYPTLIPNMGGFTAKQHVNDFAVVSENFNVLSWEQDLDTLQHILYRDGRKIAILEGNETEYKDHNVPKGEHTYRLRRIPLTGVGTISSTTIRNR